MRRIPVLLCCFCVSLFLLSDPASVSARRLSSVEAASPAPAPPPRPGEKKTAAAAAAPPPAAPEPPPLPLFLAPDAAQPPLGSPSEEEEGELREEEEQDDEEEEGEEGEGEEDEKGFIITLGIDGSFSEESPPLSTPTTSASAASASSSPASRPFAASLIHVSKKSSLLDPLYGENGGSDYVSRFAVPF